MADRHNSRLKRFINGRALNGPMRSQLSHDNALPKTQNQEIQESEEEEDEADERGREDPKKSDPEFSSALEPGSDSVTLQDRESETDSSKNPTPRRSERIRRRPEALENLGGYSYEQNQKKNKIVLPEPEQEPEPVSSISCTSPDEEVAYCLMSMRNDKWVVKEESFGEDEDEDEKGEEEDAEEEEEEETYSGSPENKKIDRKNRGKYKCETCNKLFRSYQALGGHRASHKKTRTIPTFEEHETDDPKTTAAGEKIHECSVCNRVFASGQALGGHKRSHGIEATAAGTPSTHRRPPATPPSATRKCNRTMIDLNLPAPMEDDEIDH